MELTMSSAIWQVMVDAAIMGTLLLIGEFLRAKMSAEGIDPAGCFSRCPGFVTGPEKSVGGMQDSPAVQFLWNLRQRSDRAGFRCYAHWGQA